MKAAAIVFLKAVLVFVAIGALALLLWEPHLEGRNANATVTQIYFHDPFLVYAYIAAIPFFMGLYHAFKILGYAGRNNLFSSSALRSLRTIKFCAIAIICFVVGGVIYIMTRTGDDRAGGVAVGMMLIFASIVVACATAVLERALQNAVTMKSENDLTV